MFFKFMSFLILQFLIFNKTVENTNKQSNLYHAKIGFQDRLKKRGIYCISPRTINVSGSLVSMS
jgi:hypothetical protein